MDDFIEFEGSLRGIKNGSEWEFWCEFDFEDGSGFRKFPIQANSLYEARKQASKNEKKILELFASRRINFHHENSLISGGWVGETFHRPEGKALIESLKIDIEELSTQQKQQLKEDIRKLDGTDWSQLRKKAKAEKKITQSSLNTLNKQQVKINQLSDNFLLFQGFSFDSNPEVTLATLIYQMNDNLRAINLTLDFLGTKKENISADSLCLSCLDIYLRWKEDNPKNLRGLSYPTDWETKLNLSKFNNANNTELSEGLGYFLDDIQEALREEYSIWNFAIFDPAHRAKKQFSLNPKFQIQTEL